MPGFFDAIQTMMGRPDPQQQLAAALGQGPGQPGNPAGPQPLAQGGSPPPGGGGPPGGPQQQGQQQQPQQPQILQTPPDLAQAYMTLMQRDQSSNQFYNGLALLDAGMYPGRHPEAAMRWAQGMQQDPSGLFNNLVQIRQMQQQQASLDAFQRSIPDIAKQAGLTEDETRALGPEGAGQLMAKIAEARSGVTGGPAWMAQQRAEKALTDAGQPIPWTPNDPVSFNAYNLAKAQAAEAKAKSVQEFKDSATEDFGSVDQKFTKNEGTVAALLKNMPATMSALQAPDFLTTGKLPGYLPGGGPYDQSVKNAANAMNTLKAELSSEGLRNVKNVRNVREFNTLGSALTNALDASNSPEQVQAALESIQKGFINAHATATMAAGKQLSGPLVGQGDRSFIDPKNPYYNGATEEAPQDSQPAPVVSSGGGQKLSADDITQAKTLMARDGRDAVIAHLKAKGYDTSGL